MGAAMADTIGVTTITADTNTGDISDITEITTTGRIITGRTIQATITVILDIPSRDLASTSN